MTTIPIENSTFTAPVDLEVESLMKGEAYWKPEHPDHSKVKAQVSAYFAKQSGTKSTRP